MNAQTTGHAVEYLRRSVERDKSADRDRGAGQRAANADQAARDGAAIVRTFDADWGVSGGRGKRGERHAMAELIDAVRAGQVSRIYCHTTDRLARDVEYGMTLWNACEDAGTIIRPGSQTFDPREPGYLTLWTVLLAQAQEDLARMTRKNVDTIAFLADHAATCSLPGRPHLGRCHQIGCTDSTHCRYKHERGHGNYGSHPGEDPAAVVSAYREAGSIAGAAKLLNAPKGRIVTTLSGRRLGVGRGLRTRMGRPWATSVAREVLIRAGALERLTRPGAKAKAPFILYGLLRCHCGHILTGSRFRNGSNSTYTAYKCHRARTIADHGLGSVPERAILPWVREEVARLRLLDPKTGRPIDAVQLAEENAAERTALAARLERANDLYIAGKIGRERFDREEAKVRVALDALAAAEAVVEVSPIRPDEWETWATVDLNGYVRTILREIRLGPDMRPLPDGAIWRNTALRAA